MTLPMSLGPCAPVWATASRTISFYLFAGQLLGQIYFKHGNLSRFFVHEILPATLAELLD